MKLRPLNVRTRLTLWYLAVLAGALLIYGASTSLFLVFQLRSQLDHRAIEDLETIKGLLSFTSDGKLLFHSNYQDQSYPTKMLDPLIEILARGRNSALSKRVARKPFLGWLPAAGRDVRILYDALHSSVGWDAGSFGQQAIHP